MIVRMVELASLAEILQSDAIMRMERGDCAFLSRKIPATLVRNTAYKSWRRSINWAWMLNVVIARTYWKKFHRLQQEILSVKVGAACKLRAKVIPVRKLSMPVKGGYCPQLLQKIPASLVENTSAAVGAVCTYRVSLNMLGLVIESARQI